MNAHTKWNSLISNISYLFQTWKRSEWLFRVSGKITTIPRLYNTPKWKQHQVMNVHTKWNCWIPILISLVKYCFRPETVSYKWLICICGKITTIPGLFSKYSEMRTNIRSWMHVCTLNGTVWHLFCLVWSSSNTFSYLKTLVISDRYVYVWQSRLVGLKLFGVLFDYFELIVKVWGAFPV